MIILENGEYESEEEQLLIDTDEETMDYPVKGEQLVTRRTLSVKQKGEKKNQRENLFHTRCHIQDKVYSLIINGGSCTNVASSSLVEQLNLKVQKHPKPYTLQWLSEDGDLKVQKQVTVPITIGRYTDEILCDVLPMDAGHILLGRPWQYDHKVMHDGFTNRHSFEHQGKKITLVPLSPHEVHLDQVQMKNKREADKEQKVRNSNVFVKNVEVKRYMYAQQAMILFVYKRTLTSSSDSAPAIPSEIDFIFQEYSDVFAEKMYKVYLLFVALNIRLILFQELPCQTDQPIGPTL